MSLHHPIIDNIYPRVYVVKIHIRVLLSEGSSSYLYMEYRAEFSQNPTLCVGVIPWIIICYVAIFQVVQLWDPIEIRHAWHVLSKCWCCCTRRTVSRVDPLIIIYLLYFNCYAKDSRIHNSDCICVRNILKTEDKVKTILQDIDENTSAVQKLQVSQAL